jgi:hypothetical protein|nr:MAG TPA: YopX protein [Caudoviricetes sp.]
MREIKFRAWVKEKKAIFEVILIDYVTKKVTYLLERVGHLLSIRDAKFNDIEFMQYTGLKDKNNKEIYEGDIIKFLNGIFEVIWCNEKASFMLKNKEYKEFLNFIYENNNGMEIVGNIYQNLELYEEVR